MRLSLNCLFSPIITQICLPFILLMGTAPVVCSAETPAEHSWAQFRGEKRNGISDETGLLKSWPEEGPSQLWSASGIGQGYSSPTIADGSIYITGDVGDDLVIFALDMQGKPKWQVKNGKAWTGPYPGARASITFEAGRIYHMNAHGRAVCLDARDGAEIWAVKTHERFGSENIKWGIPENLLLDKDRVIVSPGGKTTQIAALDKLTGETVWTSEPILFSRKTAFGGKEADPSEEVADKAGYASPILFEVGGRSMIAGCSGRHFYCVDAETGKMLWKQMVPAKFEVIGAIPIVFGDRIFFMAPSDFGGECFQVHLEGDGVRFESLWTTALDNGHGAFVYVDGRLLGSGYRRYKPWVCIDAATGETLYTKEDAAIGSTLWADERLYALSQEGRMMLLDCAADKFVVAGEYQFVPKPKRPDVWAHPVVLSQKLYLRYHDTLYCFDIGEKEM